LIKFNAKINTIAKSFFKINNYLTTILFVFALSELVLEIYYYYQIFLGNTVTYGELLIISLVIFSIFNMYFGGCVQYKMSKLDEIN
jgi:hypothetical protein